MPIESFISTSKQLEMLPRTEYYATYRENNRQIPITAEERDHIGKFISNSLLSLGVTYMAGGLFTFGFGKWLNSNQRIQRYMISGKRMMHANMRLYAQVLLPLAFVWVDYAYLIPRHGWEHFKNEQNYPGFIWRNLLAADENFFGFQITDDSEYLVK